MNANMLILGLAAQEKSELSTFWLVLGFGAQALFTARFIVQWLASERAGRSLVPTSFWLLSLGGSSLLLVYAIYRQDPVFILGQSSGLFIYSRNLWLIQRENKRKTDGMSTENESSGTGSTRTDDSKKISGEKDSGESEASPREKRLTSTPPSTEPPTTSAKDANSAKERNSEKESQEAAA